MPPAMHAPTQSNAPVFDPDADIASARRARTLSRERLDVGAVCVLVGLGLYGFRPVFGGWWWAIAGGSGLLAGMTIGWFGARRRLPIITVFAALIVAYVLLSGVARPDQAIARIVPTPSTMSGALADAVRGWPRVLSTEPPVGTSAGLLVLPMLCGLVGGMISVSVALRLRRSVIALAPPVGVLAISILFGLESPASLLLQGTAFGLVMMAWLARRESLRRNILQQRPDRIRALMVGVMLLAAAVVAGPTTRWIPGLQPSDRFVLRDRADPPIDDDRFASPLAGYQLFHHDRSERDRVLFTVEGLPKGARVRLAVMDNYDGYVWNVAGGSDAGVSGAFERVGDRITSLPATESQQASAETKVSFTVGDYNGVWLPGVGGQAAGALRSMSFEGPRSDRLITEFRINRSTDTGVVPGRLAPGDRFTVDALLPDAVDESSLASAPAALGSVVSVDGDVLPSSLTAYVTRFLGVSTTNDGQIVAAAGTTPYSATKRMADSLKADGFYSDGLKVDEPANSRYFSEPGHSLYRLNRFLDDKGRGLVGNAEQYAATLALMARSRGIPARVVMGFTPDQFGDGPIELTGSDMDAWVEVQLQGYGWVAIDTTPDESQTPELRQPEGLTNPNPDVQTPPPPLLADPDAQLRDPKELGDEAKKDDPKPDCSSVPKPAKCASSDVGVPIGVVVAATGVGLPVALFVAFAILVASRKRRRRLRRLGALDPSTRIAGGFSEVVDMATDIGMPLPAVATRRELASSLAMDSAQSLAARADAAIFGPGDPSDELVARYWADVDDALRSLLQPLGPIERLKARLRLTSLRSKTPPTPAVQHGRGARRGSSSTPRPVNDAANRPDHMSSGGLR